MNNRGEIRWAPFQSILNVNDTMEELERKREEAINQIREYSIDERITQDNLKKYVVIFKGNELSLLEEV